MFFEKKFQWGIYSVKKEYCVLTNLEAVPYQTYVKNIYFIYFWYAYDAKFLHLYCKKNIWIWAVLITWVNEIQVCSIEGPRFFSWRDNYEIARILWQNIINLLLKNHRANSNQTLHIAFLGVLRFFKKFQVGNYEMVKLLNLLLRNHWDTFNQNWDNTFLGKGDSSLFN